MVVLLSIEQVMLTAKPGSWPGDPSRASWPFMSRCERSSSVN